MFSLYLMVLTLCFVIKGSTCIDKRLLTPNQNDIEGRLEKLEAMFATLERKVNNCTQHMVAFTACHSKGSTLGPHQTVIYDTVITNVGKAYDVRDGEFNAPFEGLYTFSVTGMAFETTDIYLTLMKNGAGVHTIYSNTGNADSSSFSINLYLQAGDAVWIANGGSPDRLHDGNLNCFSGMLAMEA